MLKYILLILLIICSCTPKYSIRSKDRAIIITNKSGTISYLSGKGICYPYKHHKDVEGYVVMVCINTKNMSYKEFPKGQIDGFIQIYYNEIFILK